MVAGLLCACCSAADRPANPTLNYRDEPRRGKWPNFRPGNGTRKSRCCHVRTLLPRTNQDTRHVATRFISFRLMFLLGLLLAGCSSARTASNEPQPAATTATIANPSPSGTPSPAAAATPTPTATPAPATPTLDPQPTPTPVPVDDPLVLYAKVVALQTSAEPAERAPLGRPRALERRRQPADPGYLWRQVWRETANHHRERRSGRR